MTVEALLAFVHFSAILGLVVFISSEAALCRPQWLNAAVVHRLVRLDLIYLGALAAVGSSGLVRTMYGVKGAAWYLAQPLWQVKVGLFVLIALLAVRPAWAFRQWRRDLLQSGKMPSPQAVDAVWTLLMWSAHIAALVPLAAVFLARGLGSF